MESSQRLEHSAAAFNLAASLEAYEADLEAFSRSEFDPGRYRSMVHQLRDMGARALALPHLAADLMQIAIQHFDLIRILCRAQPAGAGPRELALARLVQAQCEAVRAVREKCLLLIPSGRPYRARAVARRCRTAAVFRS